MRTATARDVLLALCAARLVEYETSSYGPPLKLTKFGAALVGAVRRIGEGTDAVGNGEDDAVLDNVLVPGLLVPTSEGS